MKKALITALVVLATITAIQLYSESIVTPVDINGNIVPDLHFAGVSKHNINFTTTGSVARNSDVSVVLSTRTSHECLLYGLAVSSAFITGTDYLVVRDTCVVNTTGYDNPEFTIYMTSAAGSSGSYSDWRTVWFTHPIVFDNGICVTQSNSYFKTQVYFRYRKNY